MMYLFSLLLTICGLLLATIGCEQHSQAGSMEAHQDRGTHVNGVTVERSCDSFPIPFTSDLILNFQKGQPWPPIQHCLSFAKQEWKLALAPVGYDYIHLIGKSLKVSRGDVSPNYAVSGERVEWGQDSLGVTFVRKMNDPNSKPIREYHQLILTTDTLFHYFFETDILEPIWAPSFIWKPKALKFAFPNSLHAKPKNGMRVHYLGKSCTCAASFSCEL